MGSSSTQEWLELSLGLGSTGKEQLQKQEKEDEKRSRLYQEKLVICGTTSHEESEYVNLDLRLQIGPNNKSNYCNMGIRDFMLQHQSKKKHFHSDYSSIITNSAGLWFSLLSSPNRKGGAALPQIPKPYIRVKDEKMTVLMVKKYLLTKLGLSNQAEVELWCMGERLLHTQSLKQVRDGIWLPKLVEFVNSNSSLSNSSILFHPQNQKTPFSSSNTYLMSLHYGRARFF